MRSILHRTSTGLLALGTLVALGACDSDPVGTEDHIDPIGIVIVSGGNDLVTVTGLNIIGAILVEEGGQTDPLSIEFIDRDGNRFVPTEADEWLRVTVTHPDLGRWVADSPEGWSGTIQGLQNGSTTVRFELMHGAVGSDTSHPDFGTPGVPLIVS